MVESELPEHLTSYRPAVQTLHYQPQCPRHESNARTPYYKYGAKPALATRACYSVVWRVTGELNSAHELGRLAHRH